MKHSTRNDQRRLKPHDTHKYVKELAPELGEENYINVFEKQMYKIQKVIECYPVILSTVICQ
jgi:hypothetical protein